MKAVRMTARLLAARRETGRVIGIASSLSR
jgi:hypothetical protein